MYVYLYNRVYIILYNDKKSIRRKLATLQCAL